MPLFEVAVVNDVAVVFGPKAVVAADEKAAIMVALNNESIGTTDAKVLVRPFI